MTPPPARRPCSLARGRRSRAPPAAHRRGAAPPPATLAPARAFLSGDPPPLRTRRRPAVLPGASSDPRDSSIPSELFLDPCANWYRLILCVAVWDWASTKPFAYKLLW